MIVDFNNCNSYFMIRWTITFLIIALVAAVLGFTGIASAFAGIAKIIFYVFVVLLIVFFFMGRSSKAGE